jgi:broad specificity phosphatase PhoE
LAKTVVGLLRHGQTDWNIDLRLQGVTDVPLNETGIKQAEAAAAFLQSSDWDFIASSPLSRAKHTAEIVATKLQISEIAVEPLLLERSFGEVEGMIYHDWKRDYPDGIAPGGETEEELHVRTILLLSELLETYRGTRVLTISHGALIRAVVNILSHGEFPLDKQRISNASLSIIVHEGNSWRLESYEPTSLAERTK